LIRVELKEAHDARLAAEAALKAPRPSLVIHHAPKK
jgi:hypothetical protein